MTEIAGPSRPTPYRQIPDSFAGTLARNGLELRRAETTTLQVNVGFLCDQSCRHCHVSAGPGRTEVMSRGTMDAVESFARQGAFAVIDVTGGAPELVPGIEGFLERLAPLAPRLLFRANLTALAARPDLVDLFVRLRVVVIASFPALDADPADSQRAPGVFEASLATLRVLNAAGYGRGDSGLELDLVANPSEVEQILQAGAAKARARTVPFMAQLRHAVGLRNLADLDTGAGAAKAAKTAQTVYKQFRESDGKFYVRMVHADGTEQLSQGFADPREAGQFVAAQKKHEAS